MKCDDFQHTFARGLLMLKGGPGPQRLEHISHHAPKRPESGFVQWFSGLRFRLNRRKTKKTKTAPKPRRKTRKPTKTENCSINGVQVVSDFGQLTIGKPTKLFKTVLGGFAALNTTGTRIKPTVCRQSYLKFPSIGLGQSTTRKWDSELPESRTTAWAT